MPCGGDENYARGNKEIRVLGVITKSVHYVTTCYVLHVLTNCSIAFLAESRYEVIILADGG